VPSEWSTSGVDLNLAVPRGPGVGAGLAEALRTAVRTGAWPAGPRLPSTRLATDLGVARGTATEAYAQLVAEGWLFARQGSGARVAARAVQPPAADQPEPASRALPYDLRPGSPDTSAFRRTAWLAVARRALTHAPAEAFGYGDPRARPDLRAALAAYPARARGVRVTPDRVLVCSGFTQGLRLLCRVLADRGPASSRSRRTACPSPPEPRGPTGCAPGRCRSTATAPRSSS